MRKALTFIFFIMTVPIFALALHAAETKTTASESDYIIGEGDVLYVSVWKDQTLTRELTVLPGGKISFPLVGEMMAGGKTVALLQSELEEKIIPFVPTPYLTVEVRAINSLDIYVLGQVNRPDRFILNSQVDVLQALAMAGGINTFAKSGKIKIFRTRGAEKQILHFNYDKVSAGKSMGENILLERGDVIVVP